MTPPIEPLDGIVQEFTDALDKPIKQHYAAGKVPKAILQKGGLMKNMAKHIAERCLEAQMEPHLGYAKEERAGLSDENRRNGVM